MTLVDNKNFRPTERRPRAKKALEEAFKKNVLVIKF